MPEAVAVELRGFRGVELQLLGSQLEQLAPDPKAAQAQGGILAGADDNLQGSGRVVDQPIENAANLGPLDPLQVIQEQHDAVLDLRKVARNDLEYRPRIAREIGDEVFRNVLADERTGRLQCCDEVTQEASRVVVVFIQGQPGAGGSPLRKPGVPPSHESGLAVSGRRSDDNDRTGPVQHLAAGVKSRAGQRLARPGGGKQLAQDDRALESCAGHTLRASRAS